MIEKKLHQFATFEPFKNQTIVATNAAAPPV
jgi:hypothetical protein